jgi:predicted RNA binding protein YcfA (HicA-like mRNA interferase family)
LPQVSAKAVIRAIELKGFRFKNRRGNHIVYKNPDGRRTTVIDQGNKPLDRSVLKWIIKDTGISPEDLK